MTDANEAREVLPIVFLGQDPRFVANPDTRDQQTLARTRDFRPGLNPQQHPMETQYSLAAKTGRHLDMGPHAPSAKREELEEQGTGDETGGPKVSSATEPASGSSDDSRTGQPPTDPVPPVVVAKEKTEQTLTPPAI